jgi:FkbM family methyltransferase
MNKLGKRLLASLLWRTLGRRNLVRLGRFLSMQGRLDLNDDVHSNGEPLVRQQVARHTAGPLRVLDVGAHTGEWTRAWLDECGRAGRQDVHVHLFEPATATFRRLRESFADHAAASRLTFEPLALSSQPGRAELYVAHELAGSNSLYRQQELAPGAREEVELTSVDSYTRDRGIDHVDLMKIDAEGHDFKVLAGARELLAARKIEVVQFEYNVRWVYARHYLRDAFELLQPLGYRLGKLTRRGVELYAHWHPELESFREVNYVACLPPWTERFPSLPWWGP